MRQFRTILPGHFEIERGKVADYSALERFHYAKARPAIFAQIWKCIYVTPFTKERCLAGVLVLTWPSRHVLGRRAAMHIRGSPGEELKFVNQHVRTISRVIVHPRFRSLGISTALIRWVCKHCHTRYIEATARMGRLHPLFDRAGMQRIEPADSTRPVYFYLDKKKGNKS
jgi:GNAT superfamily N-acetyltransferase